MPDNKIADNFQSLPINTLIAEPLIAAAEGQQALVETYVKFLDSMFERENKEGTKDGKPKVLSMNISRNFLNQQTGEIDEIESKIEAPLLGLVPIPALLVKSVDIDFSLEVKTAVIEKNTSTSKMETETSAGGGFYGFKFSAKMNGSTSSQKENTRLTDQSAKYAFKVRAEQMEPSETLRKLLDLLNQTVEPIPIPSGTQKNN